MVGAGIYVLTGTVARDTAGPGVILSFLLAGIASLLAALCYAEFGARIPKAGSAYVYTYISVGEFWAFVIGWNIILEHMIGKDDSFKLIHPKIDRIHASEIFSIHEIGAASVARAWSGYVDSLAGGSISNYSRRIMHGYTMAEPLGSVPDVLAAALCLFYAMLLTLGVKSSATVNSLLTIVNLGVMGLVIGLGFAYAKLSNWSCEHGGFLPYGFTGVLAGIPLFICGKYHLLISLYIYIYIYNRCCNVLLRVRRLRFYRYFRGRGTRSCIQYTASNVIFNDNRHYWLCAGWRRFNPGHTILEDQSHCGPSRGFLLDWDTMGQIRDKARGMELEQRQF